MLDQNSTLAVINANSISGVTQGKNIHDGIGRIERSIIDTYSVLPDLRRQGEVSSLSLQAIRDDLQSTHRDIGKHHTSSVESFARLSNSLERTSSIELAILARLDDMAGQNLVFRDSWDQSSELSRIKAARLVGSKVSTSPDFMYSHAFPGKRCQEYSIRSLTEAEPLQVCL